MEYEFLGITQQCLHSFKCCSLYAEANKKYKVTGSLLVIPSTYTTPESKGEPDILRIIVNTFRFTLFCKPLWCTARKLCY
jgi:hypothetical protein